MKKIWNETIPACIICKKEHKRKNTSDWFYFEGITVCSNHPGAEKWYDACIELAELTESKEEIEYRHIAEQDFIREIYKQCDEEDRNELC